MPLSKSAPVSTWIHDFVHSKNSKFEGKSRKERIRMALGAFYSKKNEDYIQNVDRINETFAKKSSGKYYHKNVHGMWGVFHSAEPGRAVDAHDNEEARERAKSLNREHGLESNG